VVLFLASDNAWLDIDSLDAVGLGTLLLAVATFILAIVTVLLLLESKEERKVASDSLEAINRQADAATNALTAMNQQADAATNALEASNRQAESAEKALEASNRQAEIAERALEAAQHQAEISEKALEVARRQTENSEKALEAQTRPMLVAVTPRLALTEHVFYPNLQVAVPKGSIHAQTNDEIAWLSVPVRNLGPGVALVEPQRAIITDPSATSRFPAVEGTRPALGKDDVGRMNFEFARGSAGFSVLHNRITDHDQIIVVVQCLNQSRDVHSTTWLTLRWDPSHNLYNVRHHNFGHAPPGLGA
jgi:hypothetical protein